MTFDDTTLLAALRGGETIEAICKASGAKPAEFAAARDAWLARHARLGDQRLTGAVGGKVEILRDRAGVPHIYGATTADVYFGLGVAQAQDRLWQMDRLRRRALGRLGEILGAGFASSDVAHLTVGLDLIAVREPALMDGRTYETVASYVAGINRVIATTGKELPVEFRLLGYAPEPFTVGDVVAIGRGIWWSLNGRLDRIMAAESARFLPAAMRPLYLTPEASEHLVLPDGGSAAAGTDDCTGSNNWAVAGSRASHGKALLAGDPHQPFWVPSSWHEYAVHGPEDDAAGAGHPGFPGLWWGSNGTVAWAITNNMAMTRDMYREEVDPADPGRYRDGDVWRRFEERRLRHAVRGEAARELVVRSTVRGPIVNALVPALDEKGDPPLSMRWVGAEHLDDIRASIAVGRAKDWKQFRAALKDWSVAVFNFVYADAAGNVGYQMSGRIPLRGRAVPGLRDPGNPADRWTGYIPFDAMPRTYNPKGGYVASANQRIVPPSYPYPIYGAYSQGHRGIRIDQHFAAGPADHAATVRLQNDVKSVRAERSVPHILRALAASGDADAKALAAGLSGWDFRYTIEAVAPTLFETFMVHWQRRVLGEHIPKRLIDLTMQQTGLCVSLLETQDLAYFAGGSIAAEIAACARGAMTALRERLGPDVETWSWGRIHVAHWRHIVSTPALAAATDVGPAPADGGSHTVRNMGGELPPHAASSGAEYRLVVDFATPDRFLAVQNIGNSGVPGSPHYRDQFEPFLRGDYHVVQLKRAAVEAERESTTVVEPG
ncbi:MAG: penicillin acylase family protein [Alphaproteobacteria bacterium]|nr:penicillin acylase family protein [Alphaproteobacteria bacterium]